ncbi:unnamed protein product, partial [Sphacelaria rigidula]
SRHVSFSLPNPELDADAAQQTPALGGGGEGTSPLPCRSGGTRGILRNPVRSDDGGSAPPTPPPTASSPPTVTSPPTASSPPTVTSPPTASSPPTVTTPPTAVDTPEHNDGGGGGAPEIPRTELRRLAL